jgi:hypothetical protein
VTSYELDGRRLIPCKDKGFFATSQRLDKLWVTPSLLSNLNLEALSKRVKRPRREADHSLPSSAEVETTFTDLYVFMA